MDVLPAMNINPDTETVEHCILCAGAIAAVDERFGMLLGLRPPYGVMRCTDCGLRWLSPRPTQEAYEQIYAYENYFDGPSAEENYATLARQRRPYFIRRIERIEAMLGRKEHLTILDIGAATGEFVHEALKRGHRAAGIELSEGARAQAKTRYGIELSGVRVEDLSATAQYDVVHMNHVLEHMANPATIISLCARLLRSGGMLVIEVPQQIDNDLDRLRRMVLPWRRPAFNAYSVHHTYFFSPATLARLLEINGFITRTIATAVPSRAPLWPIAAKNWLLRPYLAVGDWLHQGGNVIEVYAQLPATR